MAKKAISITIEEQDLQIWKDYAKKNNRSLSSAISSWAMFIKFYDSPELRRIIEEEYEERKEARRH